MSEERFYFCYGDTTPVLDEVIEAMIPFFNSKYGLASSDYGHSFGVEAAEAMNQARTSIAESIGARPEEMIFTSGGTEANNLALKGIAYAARKRNKGNHVVTSKIEQSSILDTCEALEKEGFRVSYLDVDTSGFLDPQQVAAAIREDTILVTIQHGNGEIGTLQDIQAIGKICRQKKVPFHTDAVQSFCKVPINVEEMNIDLLTISGHLIYGPKGIGALYVRKGIRLAKLIHGGLFERNLRGGTENIPAIVGFGKAVELTKWSDIEKIRDLRQYLTQKMTSEIEDVLLTGPDGDRLPHVASFVIHFIEGESLLLHLDMRGFSVATGSACSTKKLKASHVLTALGIPQEISHGSVRMTLGLGNSKNEVDKLVETVKEVVGRLREISPMNPELMKKWQKTGEL
ncbi:MAG: cysteine desulfurase family protein [Candidatus Hodarchaeales archaeon]|jgi:cysteine desulfurase